MPEVLEAPPASIPQVKPAKHWLWTREQAKEHSRKGIEVLKAKALSRKRRRKQATIEPTAKPDVDPVADLEQRISIAARSGASAITLSHLADALAKLKRHPTTRKQSNPAPCVVDHTISSVPLEPIKPSTTQVTQAVDSNNEHVL